MTDTPQLPQPVSPIRTVFLETGEEIAEFSGSDFGMQPEWDKREIVGQGLIIRGLSESTFSPEGSAFPPARSVLYNLITDSQDTEPWGMFFTDKTTDRQILDGKENPDTSVVIKQIRQQFRKNGGRAFLITLDYVENVPATKNMPARGYYTLKKYVKNVLPEGV